jgi:hypothetical protein
MFSKFKKLDNLNLPAVSLVEVLVVLAIAATTLVTISQLTVQMLVTIKNDEINDYTTGVALQALEIVKTADDLVFTRPDAGQSGIYGAYRLDLVASPPTLTMVTATATSTSGGVPPIQECTAGSAYYVSIDAQAVGGLSPLICMQVIVKSATNTIRQEYLQMDIVTVTKLGERTKVDIISGYRRL